MGEGQEEYIKYKNELRNIPDTTRPKNIIDNTRKISVHDILKPNENKKINTKNIISFDIETSNNNKNFCLGDVYDGKIHKTFYEQKEMSNYFLKNIFPNTYIASTNLMFDFLMLYPTSELHKFEIIQNSGHFITCKYKIPHGTKINKEGKKVNTYNSNVFVDSLNYMNISVEEAGKILNLKKLEKPEFLGYKPQTEKEWKQLKEYNQRDTEVTYELMKMLQEGFNKLGGNMKITVSSTALDIYKRKYLPKMIIKEEAILKKEGINDFIYKSYYGGRTEIYKRGLVANLKYYDVCSLYPSVMCNEYPLPQSIKYIEKPTNKVFEYEGVSDVEVEIQYLHIPLLPYRDEALKKLIFPSGKWRGVYTHLEIRKAIELGYKINHIYKTYIYTKTFYPFKEYVEDIYKKRMEYQEKDNPLQTVMKLCLNSLYGKFGQRHLQNLTFFTLSGMNDEEIEVYMNSNNTETDGDNGYYINNKECKSNFVFPILPAYTTSYGRIKMFDYIIKNDAYYIDTDSIMTKHEIETSKKLGEMKLEGVIKKGILVRPKMYMMELNEKTITRIKGLPHATMELMIKILNGETINFKKFTKLKESYKIGIQVNTIRDVNKIFALEDNKRIWMYKFNHLIFDDNCKPHIIDQTIEPPPKRINYRLTVRERMLKAQGEYDKNKKNRLMDFVDSDLFDSYSVGKDITKEEFVKNEIWFETHE
jgi:hypothetical protein